MSDEKIPFSQLFTDKELLNFKYILAQVFNHTEDVELAAKCKGFIKQITSEQLQYSKNYPDNVKDQLDVVAVFNPIKSSFPAPSEEVISFVKVLVEKNLDSEFQ